jgi:hypothetical protein
MAPDEYRRRAAECLRMATGDIDAEHRLLLIERAQTWLDLAHQAEKNLTTDLVYETPPRRKALSPPMQMQQQQQIQPKKE